MSNLITGESGVRHRVAHISPQQQIPGADTPTPTMGNVGGRVDTVDPITVAGRRRRSGQLGRSTLSTRAGGRVDSVDRRVGGVGPSAVAGRRCRPEQLGPVDGVDPSREVGSVTSPAGRHCRPDPTDRVDGVDRSKLLRSTPSTRHRAPGPHRRPAGRGHRRTTALGTTLSTRRSTGATRPHGTARQCRPAQVVPVANTHPPPRSCPHRRPAGRHCRPDPTGRVDAVDRPELLGSTASTHHRARVDAVDPPQCSRRRCRAAGRRCGPEHGGGSTVSTGATWAGRQRRPDPWGRVDIVDLQVDRVDPRMWAGRRR